MTGNSDQDQRYRAAADEFGPAMQRLARATEANAERQRDLLQDMHVALWRSLAAFDGRCSMRTWAYRVAHNVAASHVDRERRLRAPLVSIEDFDQLPSSADVADAHESGDAVAKLHALIRQLKSPDRQIITLYLEELDAAAIAEITGLSPGAVATRISRAKATLTRLFRETANV